MARVSDQAWVTLATNDSYAIGALVLAQSLKRVGTSRQLAVLVTPGVSPSMKSVLTSTYDLVKEVDLLDSKDESNLLLLQRPELGVTFTKLHCWRLTQYTKAVFLDADTLLIQNSDELFDREELSAVPDVGWPDCFNSGVFVFRPNEDTYKALIQCAITEGSFDGGDQGLLNQFFSDWATKDISKHLSFIYNMTTAGVYTYATAYKRFGANVKIVHFLGGQKPWATFYNPVTRQAESGGAQYSSDYLNLWWNIFIDEVHAKLQADMTGIAGQLAELKLVAGAAGGWAPEIDSRARQTAWEAGKIDYLGQDAFTEIQKKLNESILPETSGAEASSEPALPVPAEPSS